MNAREALTLLQAELEGRIAIMKKLSIEFPKKAEEYTHRTTEVRNILFIIDEKLKHIH